MISFLKPRSLRTSIVIADAVSCYCIIILVTLMLTGSFRDENSLEISDDVTTAAAVRGGGGGGGVNHRRRPCDEIYVVGEGETLHTISDKCGDPYIVERNPHIHDPDDVFPGLVIKITPPL